MDLVESILQQTEMIRFNASTGKKQNIDLSIRRETFEIIIYLHHRSNANNRILDSTININEIKEIRLGKSCKDFQACGLESAKNYSDSVCFTIFYGLEFKLNSLSVAAKNEQDVAEWLNGLKYFQNSLYASSYGFKIHVWIYKIYDWLKSCGSEYYDVTPKELRLYYGVRLGRKISPAEILEKISSSSALSSASASPSALSLTTTCQDINFTNPIDEDSTICLDIFSNVTKSFLHNQQIFTDVFGRYTARELYKADFIEFLNLEQNESDISPSLVEAEYFIKDESSGAIYIPKDKAIDYLFSNENTIWNRSYDKIHQDMNHPLSHYWIASSHNTYLTGDQVSSKSSVEAYVRCLRAACRCVELDCFDGKNGLPMIYHGRTLTTKIPFVDVLEAIRDHAFVNSEYPVILSIENHCGIKQQIVMAEKLREIFGPMLVTEPLTEGEARLPSPEQLKRRIILKGRKLSNNTAPNINGGGGGSFKSYASSPSQESNSNNNLAHNGNASQQQEDDDNMVDMIKTGKLYLQNPNDDSVWEPYFFALTENKLRYTELAEDKENHAETESEANQIAQARRTSINVEKPCMQELHFKKRWYHGDITRDEAEARLKAFNVEGSFLIRKSVNIGQFVLSFISDQKCRHMKVNTELKRNSNKSIFYLIKDGQQYFNSLYELVTYYRKNPLDTPEFRIEQFTKPVPQPKHHENEPWFYKEMDRAGSEKILNNLPFSGAFLVRYSSEGDGFVISFRYESSVKHCRVNQDGRLLTILPYDAFENISDLIYYYQKHAFYKGVKLDHPVTNELYRFSERQDVNKERVYSLPEALEHIHREPIGKIQVRAIKSYNGLDPTKELSFKVDDIISNVTKFDGGWWKGDLIVNGNGSSDQIQKWFPYDYVEDIELLESPFGSLQKGSIELSEVTVIQNGLNPEFPYILTIGTHSPLRLAVTNYKEAKEWQDTINELCAKQKQLSSKVNQQQQQQAPIPKTRQKIAPELSQIIIYASTVKSLPSLEIIKQKGRICFELVSFNETNGDKYMSLNPSSFVWLHQVKLGRIYPKAQRFDSSNYNPIKFWNYGAQMVALNYQTPDKFMQLNHGKFRTNGKCGYVLKPNFMLNNELEFDPNDAKSLVNFGIKPIQFQIMVIAGRHISKPEFKTFISPFVEIEIYGAGYDSSSPQKYVTKIDKSNGLNPFWNDKFNLDVLNPELALIRFVVQYNDTFGDPNFLGQATFPVQYLQEGYRSVQLTNGYSEEILGTILVHLKKVVQVDPMIK